MFYFFKLLVSINIIWIQHRYRYYILYCNFYVTLIFLNIFLIVFGIIEITTVYSVFGCALRVTETTAHGFLYHLSYTRYGPGNDLSRSRSLLLTVCISGLLRFTALQSSCGMVRTGSNGECIVAVRSLLSLSHMKNYLELVVLIWFSAKPARRK